jgi:hypothetical protein
VPPDGKVALIAAAAALLPAWLMTRSLDSTRPGWAVRVYLSLMSMSELKRAGDASAQRTRYPVREAFLATWFLLFFLIFGIGLFVWPEAAGR